jgi:hypothetical protein
MRRPSPVVKKRRDRGSTEPGSCTVKTGGVSAGRGDVPPDLAWSEYMGASNTKPVRNEESVRDMETPSA